jgi:hypothetical protein
MSLTIFNRIPQHLIIQCILPYTYNPQSKRLLYDIKSYVNDFSLISSIYFTQYKECVLMNDLIKMIDKIDKYAMDNRNIKKVFTRIKDKECLNDHEYIIYKEEFLKTNRQDNIMRKIRLIWGLLTPRERTIFFNTFILDDLDE